MTTAVENVKSTDAEVSRLILFFIAIVAIVTFSNDQAANIVKRLLEEKKLQSILYLHKSLLSHLLPLNGSLLLIALACPQKMSFRFCHFRLDAYTVFFHLVYIKILFSDSQCLFKSPGHSFIC